MKKKAKTKPSKESLPKSFYLGNTVDAGEVIEAIAKQQGKSKVPLLLQSLLAEYYPCELEDIFNAEFSKVSISYQGDGKFTIVT